MLPVVSGTFLQRLPLVKISGWDDWALLHALGALL
jgi:hypothetical protein